MVFWQELDTRAIVGSVYILLGFIGLLCNGATIIMIITKRVFRLSAYTIMANVALSDAIMLILAGIVCGLNLIWPDMDLDCQLPTARNQINASLDGVFYSLST